MTVSSDCEDTAFFIRVYFVEEKVAYNLTETITSLSHLTEDYRPGEKVTIDLFTPPIAFRVKKGGKIRVDIASDGGIYVPHANKKEHWAEVTETVKANNTIYVRGAFIELHQGVALANDATCALLGQISAGVGRESEKPVSTIGLEKYFGENCF